MYALYSEKIKEKIFIDNNSKQAYLKACKWLAQNVYGTGYSNYISVKITKKKKSKKPTFIVELFVSININEVKESYCSHCKKIQTIFYCAEKPDCSQCKMHGYQMHIDSYIKTLKEKLEEAYDDEWDC